MPPVEETVATERSFTGITMELVVKTKLTKETIQWFMDGFVEDYTDVAMAAANETESVTNFAKPLISKGVLKAEIPGHTGKAS